MEAQSLKQNNGVLKSYGTLCRLQSSPQAFEGRKLALGQKQMIETRG